MTSSNCLVRLFGRAAFSVGAAYYLLIAAAVLAAAFPVGFIIWQLPQVGVDRAFDLSSLWSVWTDPRHLSASGNSLLLAGLMSSLLACGACLSSLGVRWGGQGVHPLFYGLCFLPLLIPDYVVGVAGRTVLDPTIGLLSRWLPKDVLIGRFTGLLAIAVVAAVKWIPVMFVIVDSSVEALGREKLYQVRLDYASFKAAARKVYLPQMKNAVIVVASLGFLIGFRQHQLANELTSGGGGFVSETWSIWNHRVLFEFASLPQGAAGAVFGLILLIAPILLIRSFAAGLHEHDV